MGISWEQELRDTLNRNSNNDLGEGPADALPVRVDIARQVTGIDVEVTANIRNLGIRFTSGQVTLSSSPSRR